RRIHEAGRAADEAAAGECQGRYGLPAPRRHRARAVADARGACEQRCDRWMGLEALEFVKWRQCGVLVVEIGHQPDIELAVLGVIDKATPRCRIVEWKPEIVIDLARLVSFGRDFPDFLDTKAIF